jgi:hypothetical protein
MSEPDWIKKAWEKPRAEPAAPDAPLPPLEMSAEEFQRIRTWLQNYGGSSHPDERLLVEILDCLRRIDDKLEQLIRRGEPSARRTAGGK